MCVLCVCVCVFVNERRQKSSQTKLMFLFACNSFHSILRDGFKWYVSQLTSESYVGVANVYILHGCDFDVGVADVYMHVACVGVALAAR